MCDDFGPKYKNYLYDLNMYFKLKNKYEKQWQLTKRKNLRSLKNKREGKNKIKMLEKKCIQCRRKGGTLFEYSDNVYKAKCNASENKCSLNIEIKPAKYFIYDQFEQMTDKKLEIIKDKIIKNKLNLLFDLENEDVALGEFNNLKEEFKKESEIMKFINTHKYSELYTVPSPENKDDSEENKEENKEDSKEDSKENKEDSKEKRIYKTDKISKLIRTLDDNINIFKNLLKDYRLSNRLDHQLLENAMNNYIYNILPTLKDKRELEYDEIFIEIDESSTPFDTKIQYKLIKKKYYDVCKEILVDDFNIIKRTVKKKLYSTKKPQQSIKSKKKSKIDIQLPGSKEAELQFEPIAFDVSESKEGNEIKIDVASIQQIGSIDSENMGEYMDKDLIEAREIDGIYDDKTIFKFFSRSSDSIPGKGTAGGNERIAEGEEDDFTELAGIRDWRKVLSNFHTRNDNDGNIMPLFTSRSEDEGILNWASVEHYYHAHKFKKNNPDYFRLFTMDSKSEIATDPRKALGAGGRTGYVKIDKKRKKFRDDSIQMDSDFFADGYNEKVMEDGQRLKYNQDDHSKKVLLATKDAKLVHLETRRGQKTKNVPFINTMKIRKELTK